MTKQAVYDLTNRRILIPFSSEYDPSRVEAFALRFGYALPPDLLEWLRFCNGGITAGGQVLCGLISPESKYRDVDIIETTEALRLWHEAVPEALPDPATMHWAAIAGDGVGDYYVLTCIPDVKGCSPVYFIDHEDFSSYYIVASDLWHFLQGFLLREEYWDSLEDPEEDFWWPRERERVLAFDPALRYYEGTGLLPWE